jgi:large subunit ribosomal protein L7/L12
MAKLTTDDLLGQFKEMTLVELSDFVKAFEVEFDVKASAPVAAAAAGGGAAEEAAVQDEFTLTLESAGAQKIAVIKEVRGINSSLGLKEAKDIVDAAPAVLIDKGTKEAVEKAKAALEAAGATVSVK